MQILTPQQLLEKKMRLVTLVICSSNDGASTSQVSISVYSQHNTILEFSD